MKVLEQELWKPNSLQFSVDPPMVRLAMAGVIGSGPGVPVVVLVVLVLEVGESPPPPHPSSHAAAQMTKTITHVVFEDIMFKNKA